MTFFMQIKNFFNDLWHIKEPMSRFRVAQLLFIWSLTFAWCKEGFMRVAAFLAMLLMWKTMPMPQFSLKGKDFSRTTFCLVMVFFLWIFTVPMIFGVTTVAEELQSFVKPLEVLVFILLSLFFFRGDDFEDKFAFWSVVGLSTFIFSCAVNRYTHNFNDTSGLNSAFLNFSPMAASHYIAMWFSCLTYYVFRKKTSIAICILAFCAMSLALPLAIVTYYRGSITVIVGITLFSILFAFLLIRQSLTIKIGVIASIIAFNALAGFLICSYVDLSVPSAIWSSRLQLRMVSKNGKQVSIGDIFAEWQKIGEEGQDATSQGAELDAEHLTTGRMSAWKQTIAKIKEKPIAGYGLGKSFKSFNIKSELSHELHTSEIITHPHNMMLQAAVHTGLPGMGLFALSQLALFFLALSKTVASKKQTLYFIFAMMVIAKFFAGLTEGFFMPARYFLVPFWCLAFYVMLNDSQKDDPASI